MGKSRNNKRGKGRGNFNRSNQSTKNKDQFQGTSNGASSPINDAIGRSPNYKTNDYYNGTAGQNDPNWWNRAGQITKDSASFAFSTAVGAPLRGFEKGINYFTAPGVMVLDYLPTLGTVRGSSSTVNVAARLLYDAVNSKNSRTPSYDPSDLMVFVLAVANAWALRQWVVRLCGTYNNYDPNNRYWPRALRDAMGCASDDTDSLIVQWRQVANWMTTRLNIFNIPDDIPYYERSMYMCRSIYMDMNAPRASYFMFNPRAFLKLVDQDPEHPTHVGGLVYSEFPSNTPGGITPQIIMDYFEDLVEPLFNSTAIPIMSADIEKAVGLGNCFKKSLIDDSVETQPTYNPDTLMAINNARFYPWQGVDYLIDNYAVTQDMTTNTLRATLLLGPGSDDWSNFYSTNYNLAMPINFPMDNPGVNDVIEATRFMWAIDPGHDPSTQIKHLIGTTATEILVDSYIITYDVMSDSSWGEKTIEHPHDLITGPSMPLTTDQMMQLRAYTKFGWAPLLTVGVKTSSNTPISKTYCWSDVYNYSTLVYNDLKVLNDAGWLSITGAV